MDGPHPSTASGSMSSSSHKRAADQSGNSDKSCGSTSSAAKRAKPKQPLSCQECRRLKLRCDRQFPCSSCRKRGCADVCPEGVLRPPGRAVRLAAELTALLHRVEQLESVIIELGHPERIPPPLKLEEATKRSTTLTKELEEEITNGATAQEQGPAGARERRSRNASMDEQEEEEELSDEALDAVLMGVGSLSIADSGRTRFLGTSAGSAYYDPIREEEDDEEGNPMTDAPDDRGRSASTETGDGIVRYPFIQLGPGYAKSAELERLRGYLPEQEETYRLASNYWRFLAFQFTPLEEEVFWDDYVPAAYSPEDPHGTKLACVYAILALGCVFDPDAPSTPSQDAHHYFVLCQTTLAASRFLANNDLAASQSLQLLANYFLNYHDLREGGETYFPILGMALRLLVTQGLHRDPTNFGLEGAEVNRRRRIFYELITLERMQAFISGRPYMVSNRHFDTQFPTDADTFQIAKWKIGLIIGVIIDEAFAITPPSYASILKLDQRVRDLVKETPTDYRSGALPLDAFVNKVQNLPRLPDAPEPELESHDVIHRLRAHTLDQMFSQVLFYLHKPAFAQALLKFPDEPLKSPWAASVAAVSLETAVYLLAVAKSWIRIHPVLCPRWWHIYFHAFAASVAQSSLVIKSPRSTLAPHAWSQLNEAVRIFDAAGAGGAPVAAFVPRLRLLLEKAYLSLQNVISIPRGPGDLEGDAADLAEQLAEGTDVSLSILAPPTRLARTSRRRSNVSSSSPAGGGSSISPSLTGLSPPITGLSPLRELPLADAGASTDSPVRDAEYTPYDSPIQLYSGLNQQLAAARQAGWTAAPPNQPPMPPHLASQALSAQTAVSDSATRQSSAAVTAAGPSPPNYDPIAAMQGLAMPDATSVPPHALAFDAFATSFATSLPAQYTFPSMVSPPPGGNLPTSAADDLITQFDPTSDGIDWAWFGLQADRSATGLSPLAAQPQDSGR
ncbi:hypothetical protein JCM10908_006063 [Rhodotorula pacifica]|uniref:Zn(II)2Cys6 transcription factor n=1 Tax=Rhodotorula pacifica TaxID=1495444 RepID=UPI00317B276E